MVWATLLQLSSISYYRFYARPLLLKVLIRASTSVSSASSKVCGSNLPPIIAERPLHKGSLSFSRSNLINPCGALHFNVAYF